MLEFWPVWVDDLLGIWAAAESGEVVEGMGLPTVCPSFARVVGQSSEEDVGGYGSAEVAAMSQAMARLEREQPREYRAIQARVRPWLGVAGLMDDQAAASGARRLGEWVDLLVGD